MSKAARIFPSCFVAVIGKFSVISVCFFAAELTIAEELRRKITKTGQAEVDKSCALWYSIIKENREVQICQ